jgi:hypothetical protein
VARGTKINGSDPPLTTVLPAHPTPSFLPFFDVDEPLHASTAQL